MADRLQELVIGGLQAALGEPEGRPLLGTRGRRGLFANTPNARHAANHCREAGYLRVMTGPTNGKPKTERWTLTDEGLTFLRRQTSPTHAIERFSECLRQEQRRMEEILAAARHCQASLHTMKTQLLAFCANGKPPHTQTYEPNGPKVDGWLDALENWQRQRGEADCPLPDLLRLARATQPQLSLGQFHDALRRAYESGRIYLHPWTGPLHEIPEPTCALLVGHVIAYYATPRRAGAATTATPPSEVSQ